MYAREWKCKVPQEKSDEVISYLYETGVKETSLTPGYRGLKFFAAR